MKKFLKGCFNKYFSNIIILLSIYSADAFADLIPYCPAGVETSQAVIHTPAGFGVYQENKPPHYLSGIEIASGKPDSEMIIAPEFPNPQQALWHFQKDEKYYLFCRYNLTSIILYQRISDSFKSCRVIYSRYALGDRGKIPEKIVCR